MISSVSWPIEVSMLSLRLYIVWISSESLEYKKLIDIINWTFHSMAIYKIIFISITFIFNVIAVKSITCSWFIIIFCSRNLLTFLEIMDGLQKLFVTFCHFLLKTFDTIWFKTENVSGSDLYYLCVRQLDTAPFMKTMQSFILIQNWIRLNRR